MSRDSNERDHVSQRYPMPPTPIPSPPNPWQYPSSDTSLLLHSIPTIPPTLGPFTLLGFPGPYRKYRNVNLNIKLTGAARCTWVTSSIPASTSTHNAQLALTFSHGDTDVDNVKGKRAPQTIGESVSTSTETLATGNGSLPSLSHSSLARTTNLPPSSISSSILTGTNSTLVPGSSVTITPPSFTPTVTSSLASLITTTPVNGVTSPKLTSTPSPTMGTTATISSDSPDPRSPTTSTTTSQTLSLSATSGSIPTIIFPTSSSLTTSISEFPTSPTFITPPSASISSLSITTLDSATTTKVTNFTSLSSTSTSSFFNITATASSSSSSSSSFVFSSSPDPTSFKSSKPPPQQSLTSTSHLPLVFSSTVTDRVWSTVTSTRVYTSTLQDGSTVVLTTVVQSGVLSTNTSLAGNRFSRNTGAVIAVAICATVGVIISSFVLFIFSTRYRERKQRQSRRKSRRPGLRLPSVPVSGSGTGNSGPSGGVGESSANILGTGYAREWSTSRSGEAIMGDEARPSEDGEDEEDVWRSPLVGEDDDDVVMGVGGVSWTTPPESGEGKTAGGGKSSIGHQSGHSHSLGHSLATSHSSSAHHGQGQGVPSSMAEFGMGPVSFAAYACPPALVNHPAVASSEEGGGVLNGGEGQSLALDFHGSHGSRGAFVPYPSQAAISGMGNGCYVFPASNVEATVDKPEQRQGSSRRESDGEASSAGGVQATVISASAATAVAATGTSGSRGTSGSKGSLRSIGSKNLRGFMDRIRTSVPNIQVADGMLPSRRSSKDMSLPLGASGETRPGYDYGVVGRPRLMSGGIHAPPPVAFAYPGFHITPSNVPEANVSNDLPSNAQVVGSHYHKLSPNGYPVPVVDGEGGVDEDEEDSLRILRGVVTNGLLDPNVSLSACGGVDGGSVDGRSSPNVEGASLRDYVDYSRRIGGTVKNHVTRSTTTFDTVEQDGSIHFFSNGGGLSTPV